MDILHVVGARPNFMKAAPVLRALSGDPDVRQTLVHTGQHYDQAMSEVFFRQLEIPPPDLNLGVGSGTHTEQQTKVSLALDPVLRDRRPDLVLVYGDVNSTVAAALASSKLGIRVGHVEAGLRSRDLTMPEEVNRILTDQVSDLLFTPSEDAGENLLNENIDPAKIHFVGNVMIDTLVRLLPRAEKHLPKDLPSPYVLVTLHRPSNVDDLPWMRALLSTLTELSRMATILFPVHPRTHRSILHVDRTNGSQSRLRLLEPLPYLEFLGLQRHAALVITDSGGIQEETTFLGVPCLTVRENTERPITIQQGTNQLVGRDVNRLAQAATAILENRWNFPRTRTPALWDGHASTRIARIVSMRAETKKEEVA
ncbi:MAG TPA: UDP-N-acetylglucosamine 2-epimerase (non-hydrolyzing) [Candidatus Sulfotelmatobacter sp.]|nr:UDP-N-acetylglucosamine 2-epimerase (non-hydrolyzing) [Candidatus Sulfotelmatobacter sp.]